MLTEVLALVLIFLVILVLGTGAMLAFTGIITYVWEWWYQKRL